MIPIVDRTRFTSPASFHEAMRGALEETGFAVLEGHGLEGDPLARLERAARSFFELPRAARLEAAPRRWNPDATHRYRGYFPSEVDGKDGLDFGDPALRASDADLLAHPGYEVNVRPAALGADWQRDVEAGFDAFARLGSDLTIGLAEALGGAPDALAEALARPAAQSTLRFNRYPKQSPDDGPPGDGAAPPLSCAAHFDSGLLTLLHQDVQGGLQVRRRDSAWLDVPFRPGALVINTGRALERLSGGRLPATLHRVRRTREARLSIPFFLEPRWDFPIDPRSIGLAVPEDDARVEAPTYEAFLEQAMSVLPEYQSR